MNQRKIVFATNEIYHIYNRSIAQEQIFTSLFHLQHIFATINYYRYPQILRLSEFNKLNAEAKENYLSNIVKNTPLIEIYAFAFMPNHFHLLLKQKTEEGIKKFVSLVQNSYAKYFNIRHNRDGGLFQSPFQGRWIETDEEFLHVSRYIHLNPVTSFLITIERLSSYPYTSFPDYAMLSQTPWITTNPLSTMFSSQESYAEFVKDQAGYQQTLAKCKNSLID